MNAASNILLSGLLAFAGALWAQQTPYAEATLVAEAEEPDVECPCLDGANWPGGDGTWAAIVSGQLGYTLPLDDCNAEQTKGHTTDFEVTGEWVAVTADGERSTCSWGAGADGSKVQNTSSELSAEEASACLKVLERACP